MQKTTMAVLAALLMLALAAAGCQDGETEAEGPVELEFQEIMPGLSFVDSVVGTGPEIGLDDFVEVHYTGWLYEDGAKTSKFDSSVDRGEPIAFALGRSFVIQGWDKGVPGMHVGGKRTLMIGPEMAYGAQGRPPVIPQNATLVFDIEVISLPEVHKEISIEGEGPVAELGDQLSVHYTGWLWLNGEKGDRFDTSVDRGPYNFTLGARMVIPGWDVGIEGMKVGTTATLIIPPAMGYGSKGSPPKIPPNSTLCFEVQLVSIAGK